MQWVVEFDVPYLKGGWDDPAVEEALLSNKDTLAKIKIKEREQKEEKEKPSQSSGSEHDRCSWRDPGNRRNHRRRASTP